jgi:acetoacetyl-CoA synthetase
VRLSQLAPAGTPRGRSRAPERERLRASAGATQMSEFRHFCEQRTGRRFADHTAFDAFAVAEFRDFWLLFLEWSRLAVSGSSEVICTDEEIEQAVFFPDLQLSYAENLLRIETPQDGERLALVAYRADGSVERLTRTELSERVRSLARMLDELGVSPGDRVAAVVANNPQATVAALACAAVGAMFSSMSPDMALPALLSRLDRLAPDVLMTSFEEHRAQGGISAGARAREIVAALPSLKLVLALDDGPAPALAVPLHRASEAPSPGEPAWRRFGFNHPLFVMFSSGTTGPPKCIVHGAGGTLLTHAKEHRLHADLRPQDKLFFYSTTAWMMWNWQLSALACGSTLVTYEGAITDPRALWRVVESERVSVFGTSPPYLQLCEEAAISPRDELSLPNLRAVLSTGSILRGHQYDWVREHVGRLPLQSISGGTDIIGCFLLGNPDLPVRRGKLQCRSLGLDVRALRSPGEDVGELICANPFPSRPLGLLDDADGSRFHAAYFAANPPLWTHGDRVSFDADGYAELHGRSDGVLNIQGVRIGPAEIYDALEEISELRESLAVEQRPADPAAQSRVALLVVLRKGAVLDGKLGGRIRQAIAASTTSLHVPGLIVEVPELPVTHSGKRSERAAADALNGDPVANLSALRNPESIEQIRSRVVAANARALAQRLARADSEDQSTEGRVRAIWQSVLENDALEIDADFFDIGGNSLAALRLFARLEAEFGVSLPISSLLRAPTIAAMAALLDRPDADPGAPILLASGADSRPLFLLPWWTGEILHLRMLATRIPTDRPIYGVVAGAIDETLDPRTRVAEMAERCVESMRNLQPAGPYAFVGHSFGGLLGLEVARILTASGEEIELFGAVDTEICPRWHSRRERITRYAGALLRAGPRDLRLFALIWIREHTRSSWRLHSAARCAVARAVQQEPIEHPADPAGREAWSWYCPTPYAGAMTLFRAERSHTIFDSLPLWRRTVLGGVTVDRIGGAHHAGLDDRAADELARRIAERLEEAAPGASDSLDAVRS